MKTLAKLALLLFLPTCYGEEDQGKVCLHIPEKGVETVKIKHNCIKGDIIQLNRRNIANFCDFNKAIVQYDEHDQYICVYLGEKRALREGTN